MMKQIFTLLICWVTGSGLHAQSSSSLSYSSRLHSPTSNKPINFDGQWKGGFDESNPGYLSLGGNNNDYVLELTTNGSRISGYSYTYFVEGNKRYYSICRLTGNLNRETNDIIVTEIERIKSNTPPNFGNCFQIHRLHYEKDSGNIEVLRGTWVPAPNQGAGCGNGTTVLSRRMVSNLPTAFMPHKKTPAAKAPVKKPTHNNSVASAPAKKPLKTVDKPVPTKPKVQNTETVKSEIASKKDLGTMSGVPEQNKIIPRKDEFEPRRNDIVKTINITSPSFHLSFYDNGDIDGDSITVFYNGRVVLSHQKLSDKPISLTLSLDKNARQNIVTMYADNMGTIPPNTALMIVTDGNKRYEVRIESDTEKSGSVIFEHGE